MLAIAVVVIVAVSVAAGIWIVTSPPADAEFRQLHAQIVPGTWEIELLPLPVDYQPGIPLQRALQIGAGRTPRTDIMASLALLSNRVSYLVGGRTVTYPPTPAWVLVVRGLCYASDKGELVSSARRGANYTPRRCTPNNLSLLALDAGTGKFLLSAEGYDPTLTWVPATERMAAYPPASPQVVLVPGSRPSQAPPASPSPPGASPPPPAAS